MFDIHPCTCQDVSFTVLFESSGQMRPPVVGEPMAAGFLRCVSSKFYTLVHYSSAPIWTCCHLTSDGLIRGSWGNLRSCSKRFNDIRLTRGWWRSVYCFGAQWSQKVITYACFFYVTCNVGLQGLLSLLAKLTPCKRGTAWQDSHQWQKYHSRYSVQ